MTALTGTRPSRRGGRSRPTSRPGWPRRSASPGAVRRGRSLLLATFDNRHSRRKGQVAAVDIAVTAIRVALRRRLQRGKGGIEVDFEITALAAEAAAATAAADALQASDAPLELRLGGEVVVVTP